MCRPEIVGRGGLDVVDGGRPMPRWWVTAAACGVRGLGVGVVGLGNMVSVSPSRGNWSDEAVRSGGRGALRVYLGAAPGVGKTYAIVS